MYPLKGRKQSEEHIKKIVIASVKNKEKLKCGFIIIFDSERIL